MTADLVLYHYSGSTADITLRILNLLGVPFDLISIESKAGDLKTASYLALNPNGLVPLLVHKGTPIFESAAITIYLGETFGEARDLFPSRGPLRGEALKWIVWGTATLSNRLWTLYGSKSDKDLEAVSEAMRVLDNELKNKEFLLGSEYSIVDTHVAEIVGWMSHTSLDMNQFKTVASYCERCKNRVLEDVNMDTAEKKSSNAFIDAFDTVVFDAPPAKVYALLTESNEFATWSGTHAAIPHQHGVEFKTHGGNFLFKFVTCITDKMIVAHFREERWEWDGFATVMFALIATGSSKTTLNFSIYGVPGGDPEKKQHVQAWQESFFEPMKAYLKRGAPAPFCGVDIQVKDLNRAERFYKTTFNWTFTEMPEKVGSTDERIYFTGHGANALGGRLTTDPHSIRPYINVQNLDETLKLVKSKGGELVTEVLPAGDDGHYCSIKDPEGNIVGLFSQKPPAPDLAFYHIPYTTSGICLEVIQVLGVPFELKKLDSKADTKAKEYLALNPNGQVPLLVHKGIAIFESAAITIYLGETFGVAKGLFPPPGPTRGEALKWIVWSSVTLGGATMKEDAEGVVKAMKILDAALDGKGFMMGDYSLVDAHVVSIAFWVQMTDLVDFTTLKRIPAWMDVCIKKQRPS